MAVIHRAHTQSNIAPAVRKLLAQVNAAYPKRSKASDGIWPSAAHSAANPNSDHEAGNALDLTDDLGGGKHIDEVVAAIVASKDARLKYVIHNGRIWSPTQGWHTYTGSNPHTKHAHFSVYESKRTSDKAWQIAAPPKEAPVTDDIQVHVSIKPEKFPALAAWLKANGVYATATKYEAGRPTVVPVNPNPLREGK